MARFVIFETPGGTEVMVNVDHVVAVDGLDIEPAECQLWLSTACWNDVPGQGGQRWVRVLGTLSETHTMLNANDGH